MRSCGTEKEYTMPKFRKKPVVIEAEQYDGSQEMAERYEREHHFKCRPDGHTNSILYELFIPTLEGTMQVGVGDWIICGVKGEFYPCKPDIFEATYEPVPHDA
jgi:hypothetical protein